MGFNQLGAQTKEFGVDGAWLKFGVDGAWLKLGVDGAWLNSLKPTWSSLLGSSCCRIKLHSASDSPSACVGRVFAGGGYLRWRE